RADAHPARLAQEAGHLLGRGLDDIPRRWLRGWSVPALGDQEGRAPGAAAVHAAPQERQGRAGRRRREARPLLLPGRRASRGEGVSPRDRGARPGPTLTLRALNRAMLARQMLLERQKVDVVTAIERLAALQAQWSPSPYIALWSRVADFRREQLWSAIERHRVIRARLMPGALQGRKCGV